MCSNSFWTECISPQQHHHLPSNQSCHLKSSLFGALCGEPSDWPTVWSIREVHCLKLGKAVSLFCGIFSQVKAKSDADMLFYRDCHFLGTPNSLMESHTLVLKRQHSTTTCATAFNLQAGNGVASSIYECQKLGLRASVSSCGQSGNYLNASRKSKMLCAIDCIYVHQSLYCNF